MAERFLGGVGAAAALVFAVAGLCAAGASLAWVALELDGVATRDLEAMELPLSTRVVDRNGRLLGELYEERRRPVRLEALSPDFLRALLAAEDAGFFQHAGVDVPGMARAAWVNLRAGDIRQGASTLTQQLARNLFLTPERTWQRKAREAVLALRLEVELPKGVILERYVNTVYFGSGAYGVSEAARTYFRKPASDLDVSESALLVGLLPRPSSSSPFQSSERAEAGRRRVLQRMHDVGLLSPRQFARALDAPPRLAPGPPARYCEGCGWVMAAVRRALEQGEEPPLARRGWTIHTTIDRDLQEAAHRILQRETARWGEEAPPQGAVFVVDTREQGVLAYVGGRDFAASPFDRALRARRQPGSAFKPVVYAAALARGHPPSLRIPDRPFVAPAAGSSWTPRNHDGRFHGMVTLREALVRSMNAATAHLVRKVGIDATRARARCLGIDSPLPRHVGVGLGAAEVGLAELTRAYATIAAGGIPVEPVLVRRVVDAGGREIDAPRPPLLPRVPADCGRALDAPEAFVLTDMLRGAVTDPGGTARAAGRLPFDVAGKTGTTNGGNDAWFVGFSPAVTAGVWIGHDRPRRIGRGASGAATALPVWRGVMEASHAPDAPTRFRAPPGIEHAWVDRASGLRAGPGARGAFRQAFAAGTAPRESAEEQQRLRSMRRQLLRAGL